MTDLIPHDFAPEKIGVTELLVSYCQEADSNAAGDDFQNLEVKTEDAGGGVFFVIKTDRWAFNDVDELINVLNDFKKRINTKERDE